MTARRATPAGERITSRTWAAQPEQILAYRSRDPRPPRRRKSRPEHLRDEIRLGRPAAIERGLPRLGARRDTLHRQAFPADGAELIQGRVQDRPFECGAAPSGTPLWAGAAVQRELTV